MYNLKLPLLKTPQAALNVTAKIYGEATSENSWWRVQPQDSSLHKLTAAAQTPHESVWTGTHPVTSEQHGKDAKHLQPSLSSEAS